MQQIVANTARIRKAKRLFGVKICLVSLLDADRQWFKSKQGIDVCETDRAISFCGHVILDENIMFIPDASQDSRFSDNPLVTGPPHIRFCAGCPVHSPEGYRVGTLCLIDSQPREFSEDDQHILSSNQRRRVRLQYCSRRKPNNMPPRCAKCATPGALPDTPRYSSSRP